MSEVEGAENTFGAVDDLLNSYLASDALEAYNLLQEMAPSKDDQKEWNRRAAEACYSVSNDTNDRHKRIDWLRKGRTHALDAYQSDKSDVECVKILCSTTGRLAEETNYPREKINLGFEFKSYLDAALQLSPRSYELLHMRGRFALQVCSLSAIERLAARAIGTLPQVSLDGALQDLLQAEDIIPETAENALYIGKVYHAKSDYSNAKKWLQKVLELASEDEESVEREHTEEAKEMLKLKCFK